MTSLSQAKVSEQLEFFLKGFQGADGAPKYRARIGQMIAEGKASVLVDYEDLLAFDTDLAITLIQRPDSILPAFKEAAYEAVKTENFTYADDKRDELEVRIKGITDKLPLRSVAAKYLDRLVAINGMVVRTSEVQPLALVAAFRCPNGHLTLVPQAGALLKTPNKCGECEESRNLELDKANSKFTDYQVIRIQELPEELPPGQLPTSIDAGIVGEIVSKARPGDRVVITGVVRAEPETAIGRGKLTVFRTRLETNYLDVSGKEPDQVQINVEDEAEIKRIAALPDAYDRLINSIAPSIYGFETQKEAVLLMVTGAPQGLLPDGTTIRGDLNCLLVGDPGCLVADERVVLGDGRIAKIGKIGTNHLQQLELPVLIGKGGNRAMATTFHIYRNQPTIEIITESGKSIRGTCNHPLLAVNAQDQRVREWRRLDQFKVGDRVAVVSGFNCTVTGFVDTGFAPITRNRLGPRFHRLLPTKVTPELAAFLGYMVGDGWVCKDGYRLGFVVAQPEIDLLPRLQALARGLFGFRNKSSETVKKGRRVHLHYVYLSDKDVAHNLAFLKEKRVPDLILQSGDKVVAPFLRWLFEADGCVFDNGRGRRAISLKAKDIELLRDVQMLLLRFGIHSRIVGNALMIRRGESIVKFAREIGFVSRKKVAKLNALAADAGSFKRFRTQHSERIAKILQRENADVFDIEVPDGHRFIANGIVSHNTAKSELLKYVSRIAPRGLYTTGRGSTAAGLCIAPDSLVTTEDGAQTIEELVEGQLLGCERILESGEIVSQNPQTKKIVAPRISERNVLVSGNRQSYMIQDMVIEGASLHNVSQYYRIKAPRMLRIKTRLGREIALTPETKLASYDRQSGQTRWKHARDIRKGDSIILTTRQPEMSHQFDVGPLSLLDDSDFVELDPTFLERLLALLKHRYGRLRSAARQLGVDENKLYHFWPKGITNPRLADLKGICKALELKVDADIEPHVRAVSYKSYKGIERMLTQWNTGSLMYFLGSVYSDGCVGVDKRQGRSYSIRFSSGDYEDCMRFKKAVGDLFGIGARIEKEAKENCYDVRFSNKFVTRLVMKLGMPAGVKPNDLRMSSQVDSLPSDQLARFLSGLYDHDGCVTKGKCVSFATSSGILARQVEQALERYDIVAGIRRKGPAVAETRGLVIRSRGTYEVEIYDGISLSRFAERIGFANPKKQRRLFELLSEKRLSHSNFIRMGYGLIAAAVVSVSEESASTVYDLTVDDVHSFVANGFIVHNTAAVVKEKSGLMMLEAGAVVLADQGVACLTEDTELYTGRGLVPVSLIWEMASGRTFITKTGREAKETFLPVGFYDNAGRFDSSGHTFAIMRRRHSGEVIKLTFASGLTLKVTPEHLLRTTTSSKKLWVQAGSVEAGQFLRAPVKVFKPSVSVDISPEEAYVVGCIYGDGWLTPYGATISQSRVNTDVVENIERHAPGIFARYDKGDRERTLGKYKLISRMYQLFTTEKSMVGKSHFLLRGPSTDNILLLSDKSLWALLAGVFDTDGDFNHVRGKIVAARFYPTRSEHELAVLVYALRRLGVVGRIQGQHSRFPTIQVTGPDITRFVDGIKGFSAKTLRETNLSIAHKNIVRGIERVVKVERVPYDGYVYDLSVGKYHNFEVSLIYAHNCIDEFDKMRVEDRGVLHEVMEQQTVSVAKGGIVATLNARTSILAAANPVFGKYDPYKNIYENVNLPTPLLTRFDLVFIIRDIPDRAKDEKLASHILETHRAEAFIVQPPLGFDMLRKYLIYAKKVTPKLTREAQERLLQFYLDLRASSTEGTIAITPRQLEALIRISTARARLLLRDKVTIEDALQAINLMRKMLESVGIDVRTGKVDLGVLQGRPASERGILEKAMDVFRQLHGPEKKPVEAKAFVDELVKTGDFSAEEARRVISTLYKLGQIYEIRSGYYSKIS